MGVVGLPILHILKQSIWFSVSFSDLYTFLAGFNLHLGSPSCMHSPLIVHFPYKTEMWGDKSENERGKYICIV